MCAKFIAAQEEDYRTGTIRGDLLDQIDRLDFRKCNGTTIGGDTNSISVGFEQLKLNLMAKVEKHSIFTAGDPTKAIGMDKFLVVAKNYFLHLNVTDLPANIFFYGHNKRFSEILNDKHHSRHRDRSRSQDRSRSRHRSRE